MNFTRFLTSYAVAIILVAGGSAIAQSSVGTGDLTEMLAGYASTSIAGQKIEDLRERSKAVFERLDENQSGSITLDELDVSVTEEEEAKMTRLELRQWRHRTSVIQSKFLKYDEETEEFEIVDKNSDGVLNEEEYLMRYETILERGVEFGFNKLDLDKNGGVELLEFNKFLDDLEEYDEDGDGTISAVEAKKSGQPLILPELMSPMYKSFELIDRFTDEMKAIEQQADDSS